jgi:hypothetical protein
METLKVITDHTSHWVDSHERQPANGSRVQALTIGGVQVSLVWTSDSIKWIDAWQSHMKVPATVKARQLARYNNNAAEGHP